MAPTDPIEDLPDTEETYHESSDEDFNPAAAPPDESSSSSSSDEGDGSTKRDPQKRKRKRKAPSPIDLDSGDEVTLEAARKRKAKKRKGNNKTSNDEDILLFSDDEGGEGGLVKTRAQRRVEQKERRPLARTDGATVDVDALWAQMSATPLKPLYSTSTLKGIDGEATKVQDTAMGGTNGALIAVEESDLVAVKRIYTFAGQRTTEEQQIPRSSLDKYLAEGWKAVDLPAQGIADEESAKDTTTTDSRPKIRRPLRRPSRFDPNPTGQVRGLAPEHQLTWPRQTTKSVQADQENMPAPEAPRIQRPEKAQKLNVVDKSRHDWTKYVDKEGIAEELDEHEKTKEAYLGRMDFLASVEAKREEERLRMKSKATS
ncbi:bucentaur or craniofacial development-domain-containing protein [Clohesyomyces aquaticus]|uniref:SWR1-complex protein 5 n=1 Tax=Clohesyomyces aquaticus TaxID=1231657 RepID=A0A1Y1ZU94_9PLEO|nr:bucentaur or craniofacial development-domain-containing protein [Clohesyomyces aquaticus]